MAYDPIDIPTLPNNFSAGTRAVAAQVNANFDKHNTEAFTSAGYLAVGWFNLGTALVFNSANSLETASDFDLTTILQVGDKISFHQTTGGVKYGFITTINYNDTVANRTFIRVFVYNQVAIADEAIPLDSIGFSRAKNPWGFPLDEAGWSITDVLSGSHSLSTASFSEFSTARRLVVPAGKWKIGYQGPLILTSSGTSTEIGGWFDLSESPTAQTSDLRLVSHLKVRNAGASASNWIYLQQASAEVVKEYTTQVTLHWIGKRDSATSTLVLGSISSETVFYTYATIAYL